MTTLLAFAALATLQTPQAATSQPSAGAQLISKAFRRYYDCQSLTGKIRLTQSAKGVTLVIDTEVQFDQPSKLYVRQVRGGSMPKEATIISDGEKFSYTRPYDTLGRPVFQEMVTQHGYTQTVRDMYSVSAKSSLDRSPVLDIAIGRATDLREIRTHWGSPEFKGKTQVNGITANIVEGTYFDIPGEDATGTFQFLISDDGDLIRYGQIQKFGMPNKPTETFLVTSTWDADLHPNAKTNPALYRP